MSRTTQPVWDLLAAREVAATIDAVPPVLILLDVDILLAAGEGET